MGRTRSTRNRYLTNAEFQLKFVGGVLVITLIVVGIFYLSHLYFIWRFIALGKSLGFQDDHVFFRFMAEQKRMMESISLVTAAIVSVMVVTFGIFLSHRVAGPLARLKDNFEEARESSELKKVKFRKGDFFQDVGESFNRMVDSQKKRGPR